MTCTPLVLQTCCWWLISGAVFSVHQHPASTARLSPQKHVRCCKQSGRTPPLARTPCPCRPAACCVSPGPRGKRRRVLSAALKALLPEPLSLVREHPYAAIGLGSAWAEKEPLIQPAMLFHPGTLTLPIRGPTANRWCTNGLLARKQNKHTRWNSQGQN